jgi:hypothetical protein
MQPTNPKKGETQWEREHNKLVKAKLSKQKKANPLTITTFWILVPTHPSHVKQVHNTNQWDWNFDHNLPIKHITICKNAKKAKVALSCIQQNTKRLALEHAYLHCKLLKSIFNVFEVT